MHDPPYQSFTDMPSVEGQSTNRPIRYFKAWLVYVLVTLLISFGVGAVVGAIAGGIMGAAGVDMATLQRVCQALGFLMGVMVSFVCYRWSIQKFILSQLNAPSSASGEAPTH